MKILFIPFAPSLAHMTRCLSIAETMKAEKNDCFFAVGIEGKNFIEKAGFNLSIVPEVDSDTFKNDRGWNWLTQRYFIENLNAELKIIDDFNPDIIIYDFRFTTKLAAHIKSIKSFSIVHASALSLIIDPQSAATRIIADYNPNHRKRLKNKIFEFIFPKVFKMLLGRPIKKIRPILKQYNCTGIDTLFDLLLGDFNLIADTIEFIPNGLQVPQNCHLVGPLTWSGWDKDSSFPLPELTDKPIIYITMGSTVEAKPTILKLVESLKGLPYNIIISKGQTEFNKEEIPDNVFLYSYVPGNYIASKSSLAIYHGGHETLMQVLSNGIPSLVIPVNPDQILVAKQIKSLGIGNFLKHPKSSLVDKQPLNYFSTNEIKNEVLKIIDDKQCKNKCETMKGSLNKMIESKECLKIINYCCQQRL
jgi:UDP:flavonoid glycosyltransferase YjiC (YdhE family)